MAKQKTAQPSSGKIPLPKIRRGPKAYIAEVIREMKKVNWPSPAENNRLTLVVLVVSIFIATCLYLLSQGFHTVISILTKGSF